MAYLYVKYAFYVFNVMTSLDVFYVTSSKKCTGPCRAMEDTPGEKRGRTIKLKVGYLLMKLIMDSMLSNKISNTINTTRTGSLDTGAFKTYTVCYTCTLIRLHTGKPSAIEGYLITLTSHFL